MPTPTIIHELTERFDRNIDAYKSGKYNETQARREFIDPMFEALGWDVSNRKGYAESYKDVVHEDAVKVGRSTKAPDYGFRIGGQRKFFLEAKKPSVNIKRDIHPAYQLRRYAWSAKLPLSILTDFEEFAVYDCRVRPVMTDKASHSRIMYLTYKDYVDQWDDLYGKFSRDAILKGSFDKYVASKKAKRGTAEVDATFLQEIERWRNLLARNIALRNPDLTQRQLNFSVQRTIDRIIFLRIVEDRGIEDYGRLMALQNGNQVYKRLAHLFDQADDRYNSGLFHFRNEKGRSGLPDSLTRGLIIDDKVLKDILNNLYYPNSPYEFSVLPADILGQVYEQFLGKVIRLTPAHRAVVEDKPEVKKAGGVYYTPTYIVDYIVKQTVGKLVEGKKPGPRGSVSKLRILDPACGSGSFLLGAYQFLLDWHRDQYTKDDPQKWATGRRPAIYQSRGEWKLTIDERKRILLNNIYGVDIDSQAVEVTRLSLLLKALEHENEQSINRQMAFFHQRVLPDLGNNIKCGNSLIGSDFYDGQMSLLDEEEMYRINVFDWEIDFSDIMGNGGFDAVIGNPPYVRQEMLKDLKPYFEKTYKVYKGMADLYVYFIEKAISLLRSGGMFAYIVANKWMRAKYGEPLRRWLKQQGLIEILDFGDLPVFKKATTYPCVMTIQKGSTNEAFFTSEIESLDFYDLKEYVQERSHPVTMSRLADAGWSLAPEAVKDLLAKLRDKGVPLGDYLPGKIYYGIKTGLNKAFVINAETRSRLIAEDARSEELIKPLLVGRDIKRYQPPTSERFLILIQKGWTNKNRGKISGWSWLEKNYSAIANYLVPFAKDAEKRYDKGDFWWELRACDYYAEFEKSKFLLPDISTRGNFILDKTRNLYCMNTAYIIPSEDVFLFGILNSRLITFFYEHLSAVFRGGYLRFIYQYLVELPIRAIDFTDPTDMARHDQMVTLVQRMLDLNQRLAAAKVPQATTMLQRQIAATDRQIDKLVYELYDLTDEEIKIVEGQ
ncbi:MAG: restriction endonuclease subunit R [Candidatus Cloacimonetes bacterium 4572_55]|nr:MAG: restriction endonuclease subunit R [Candidatus Cloacimonetes bacterium 4572_55]